MLFFNISRESNPLIFPWTAWPNGSGRWDNLLAAQHLPRDLVRPSSGLKIWLKRRGRRRCFMQGWIQPVKLWRAISVICGSHVSLRDYYCKLDEVYFTTLLWQKNGRQNDLISRKLFSKLYIIMANEATFLGFRAGVTNLFGIAGHFVSYRWVIGPHNFLVILWNLLVQDCWSRLNASRAARNSFEGRMFVTPVLEGAIGLIAPPWIHPCMKGGTFLPDLSQELEEPVGSLF